MIGHPKPEKRTTALYRDGASGRGWADRFQAESMSPTRLNREKLAADNQDTSFYILVDATQALDIASGYVPNSVKAQVRTMLDWHEEDERRAARPVKKRATP